MVECLTLDLFATLMSFELKHDLMPMLVLVLGDDGR